MEQKKAGVVIKARNLEEGIVLLRWKLWHWFHFSEKNLVWKTISSDWLYLFEFEIDYQCAIDRASWKSYSSKIFTC